MLLPICLLKCWLYVYILLNICPAFMSICLPFLLYVCGFFSKDHAYTSIEDSMAIGDQRVLTRYKAKRGNTALPLLGGSDRPGSQAACRLLLGGGRMRPFKLQMLMWLMFPKTTPMPWSMGSSISKTQLCLCWHFSMKLKSAFSTTRSEVKISGKTSFNFGLFRWVETWIWPNKP